MRALVQRVAAAAVSIPGERRAGTAGLAVLVGIVRDDTPAQARRLAERLANLRCFDDSQGKMNLSVCDTGGGMLLVPQFTLCADTRKGNRPAFTGAAPPEKAEALFNELADAVRGSGVPVVTGWFREHMQVEITNDGPVTFIIEANASPGPATLPAAAGGGCPA